MLKVTRLIIFFITVWSFVFAELKIGYVDSNEIMSSFEEVKQVQVDLEKVQRRLENEMNDLMNRLDSLNQDFDRQRLLMSENRRQEKEKERRKLEENIQKFQMEKFGPEGEIYRKQNLLLKPVLTKIDAAIKNVGSEQSYDFILDAMSGALLYALDSHNLTEDVLEELSKATGSGTD
jgi:outer membrane protein